MSLTVVGSIRVDSKIVFKKKDKFIKGALL